MDPAKEILKAFKKGNLMHFECKKCKGTWDSKYKYVKCPGCGSEELVSL